jgi:hypothetical protein
MVRPDGRLRGAWEGYGRRWPAVPRGRRDVVKVFNPVRRTWATRWTSALTAAWTRAGVRPLPRCRPSLWNGICRVGPARSRRCVVPGPRAHSSPVGQDVGCDGYELVGHVTLVCPQRRGALDQGAEAPVTFDGPGSVRLRRRARCAPSAWNRARCAATRPAYDCGGRPPRARCESGTALKLHRGAMATSCRPTRSSAGGEGGRRSEGDRPPASRSTDPRRVGPQIVPRVGDRTPVCARRRSLTWL